MELYEYTIVVKAPNQDIQKIKFDRSIISILFKDGFEAKYGYEFLGAIKK